jgi:hypothetical protein
MGAAPTMPVRERDWSAYASVPPPPSGPRAGHGLPPPTAVRQDQPAETPPAAKPGGHEFDAEMDAAELDDRERPGPPWTARGTRLSRSGVVIRSRRMSFAGRKVLLAVHLIDSEPVPLCGLVRTCDYEGEGLYTLTLDFVPVPERPEVREWLKERGR